MAMTTTSMHIAVKALDETDDGYLVLNVRVPTDRVKFMCQGNVITLSTGTPAVLLGVGSTHEKAADRCDLYLERIETEQDLLKKEE